METHAGTPAHSRAQAPSRLSAIFFRYTEAAPVAPRRAASRRSRDVHPRDAGTLQSVTTLFDTARLDLRLSTRHFLSPLSLVNPVRGCIRALRQHICHKDCTHGLPRQGRAWRVFKLALPAVTKFHSRYLRLLLFPERRGNALFIIIAFSRNRSADFARNRVHGVPKPDNRRVRLKHLFRASQFHLGDLYYPPMEVAPYLFIEFLRGELVNFLTDYLGLSEIKFLPSRANVSNFYRTRTSFTSSQTYSFA